MRRNIRWGVFAAALWGGAALAQGGYDTTYTGEKDVTVKVERNDPTARGPYVLLGGGIEGYTGRLAPSLDPGISYGAQLGFRALSGLGFEVGYNGGLHNFDTGTSGGLEDGADVVRNAGQAVVVGNLPLGNVSPYVLGGVGIQNQNIRGPDGAFSEGFVDDTSGYVPAGVGLRVNITDTVAADARATYNIPFSQDFAPFDTNAGSGIYQGLLQLGGQF
ncbi:hypothetical protein P2318_33160 [Myxococcaceae bacterium GXIMD 01537]